MSVSWSVTGSESSGSSLRVFVSYNDPGSGFALDHYLDLDADSTDDQVTHHCECYGRVLAESVIPVITAPEPDVSGLEGVV